jgi:3' terminal RNA ribose 2'-O-methyltransferase Hen1
MLSITLRRGSADWPASDLGYLLHKFPGRWHDAKMTFGQSFVFYPEANDEVCTAVLALDVDAVGLMRERREAARWKEYVNDRPYAASSFLSSAMLEMFRTAMSGRSKERQELADSALDLEFRLPVVKVRGGEGFLRRLLEPLGYEVAATRLPLDENFPEWGESFYFDVTLKSTMRLADALNHLYLLIPVLDDDKHYWVSKDEIEKLMRKGGDWLKSHPEKEEITRRYLIRQRNLMRVAMLQLTDDEDVDAEIAAKDEKLEELERPLSLHQMRINRVVEVIQGLEPERILDLGCGEGKLIQKVIKSKGLKEIVGMDVSLASLERVKRTVGFDRLAPPLQEKLKLVHGSLTYRDKSLEGFDVAALVEVIEHMDEARLGAMAKVLFGSLRPRTVILTTPNREYNTLFEGMAPEAMRHGDHRFEWTRAEFGEWCDRVAAEHGYTVVREDLGPIDETHGAPSQMGVFSR